VVINDHSPTHGCYYRSASRLAGDNRQRRSTCIQKSISIIVWSVKPVFR
jgi:hypothetical protein